MGWNIQWSQFLLNETFNKNLYVPFLLEVLLRRKYCNHVNDIM